MKDVKNRERETPLKYVYIGVGLLCFGLGALGAVLPVLPTTPFLLLTAYCFAKGSQKFHDWFVSTELYRRYLGRFLEERAMTLKSKVLILSYASTTLAVSFALVDNVPARSFILLTATAMYYYFFRRIRTIRQK